MLGFSCVIGGGDGFFLVFDCVRFLTGFEKGAGVSVDNMRYLPLGILTRLLGDLGRQRNVASDFFRKNSPGNVVGEFWSVLQSAD